MNGKLVGGGAGEPLKLALNEEDSESCSLSLGKEEADGVGTVSKEEIIEELGRLADSGDRKSTRLNSSHVSQSRMPSSA